MFRVTMVLLGLVVLAGGQAGATTGQGPPTTVVDFYADGVIQEGDIYGVVNVWDNANVVMTGGDVWEVHTHGLSTFTVLGTGSTTASHTTWLAAYGASSISITGGATYYYLSFSDSAVGVVTGGFVNCQVSVYDDASLNVYGHGFDAIWDARQRRYYVSGFWADGAPFHLEMTHDAYLRTVFHEIPEPTTLGLLLLGSVLMRRGRCG